METPEVHIIGSGVMGTGIARLHLNLGRNTWIFVRDDREHASLVASIQTAYRKNEKRIGVSWETYCSKLRVSNVLEDLRDAKFVLEAVTEDMDIKKAVYQEIVPYIRPEALIATNTSSLSITELAGCVPDSRRFLGIHFFNPATSMKLVELVKGMATSHETVAQAVDIVRSLGKEPVFVEESPGFIVNRLLIPMINEAVGILSENLASRDDIDKAMVLGTNHPMGPLRLADLIGNDVVLKVMEILHQETGDPKYRAHPLLRKYVRSNWLGRKTRKGFYDYE